MLTTIILIGAVALSASELVSTDAELVSEGYTFTEGPLWIPGQGLIFSDVQENTIYRSDHSKFRNPSNNSNGLALDPQGRLIACESGKHRLTRTEANGEITELVSSYKGKRLNSTNDVTVRSDGLILFTDPKPLRGAENMPLEHSGVYSLNPETGAMHLLTTSLKYPNGIGLSPDESTLYVSDTSGAVIKAYDLKKDGTVTNERVHCEVRIPDGMAVDTEGKIWSSSSGGISVYDASGTFLERIRIPVMPTNCAFGGEDGRTLYVTARKKVFSLKTNSRGWEK